jgi:hypothetical protein
MHFGQAHAHSPTLSVEFPDPFFQDPKLIAYQLRIKSGGALTSLAYRAAKSFLPRNRVEAAVRLARRRRRTEKETGAIDSQSVILPHG